MVTQQRRPQSRAFDKRSFPIFFAGREHLLDNEVAFVIWEPGTPHTWRAEEESLILTIRWPSRPLP